MKYTKHADPWQTVVSVRQADAVQLPSYWVLFLIADKNSRVFLDNKVFQLLNYF
jgi:hypothetical protein